MEVLTVVSGNARRRRNHVQALAARASARRRADALGLWAERYQVLLHVDRDTLSDEGEPGRSELEDGTRVSAGSARRRSCDTGLVGVLRGEGGEVLDVGRRRRTVPPALEAGFAAVDATDDAPP